MVEGKCRKCGKIDKLNKRGLCFMPCTFAVMVEAQNAQKKVWDKYPIIKVITSG